LTGSIGGFVAYRRHVVVGLDSEDGTWGRLLFNWRSGAAVRNFAEAAL
jgi:hypothetical protein